MKVAAGVIAAVIALPLLTSAAREARADTTASVIPITATVADVRAGFGDGLQGTQEATLLRLWNRRASGVPIGYAFVSCVLMGRGGAFGDGVRSCQATYHIGSRRQQGYITASGIQHSDRRYTFSVTGGTGVYSDAGGVIYTHPSAVGELRVIFRLT